jgi:hypothetical protein
MTKLEDGIKQRGRELDDRFRSAVDPYTAEAERAAGARPGSWKDYGRIVAIVAAVAILVLLVKAWG